MFLLGRQVLGRMDERSSEGFAGSRATRHCRRAAGVGKRLGATSLIEASC